MTTAVIVNDRGEAFVGWRSSCSLSENGVETWYSSPYFSKEKKIVYSPTGLWPADHPIDEPYYLDRPYVFASARSARRAARRMWGRVAVVV